jgi:LAS superfamily LD-carboxypeptidase LdcB
MAAAVSRGIAALNRQGITPAITSGYRSAERQRAIREGPAPYGAAREVSGHQVGLSADFGPNANPGLYPDILQAMTEAGLANGAKFRRKPDPIHFMVPGTIKSQTAALAAACADAYRRR